MATEQTKNKRNNWFNDKQIQQQYESINESIISSLNLKDLNDDNFLQQFEYPSLKQNCHWLIPNILMIGRNPSTNNFIKCLLNEGITTFISLTEFNHSSYHDKIKQFAKNTDDIKLISFPIRDFCGAKDDKTMQFLDELTKLIINGNNNKGNDDKDDDNNDNNDDNDDNKENNDDNNDDNNDKDDDNDDNKENKIDVNDTDDADGDDHNKETKPIFNKIYMHCQSGHGRTGIIACLLLQCVYNMDSKLSVKYLNEIHEMRCNHQTDIDNGQYKMPETHQQYDQIQRLHDETVKIYNKYKMK